MWEPTYQQELPAPVLVDRTGDCTSAYSQGTRASTRRASRMGRACEAGSRVDRRCASRFNFKLIGLWLVMFRVRGGFHNRAYELLTGPVEASGLAKAGLLCIDE